MSAARNLNGVMLCPDPAREPVQTDALDAITVFVNEDDVVLAYFAHAAAAGDRHPPLRATRGIEHYVLGG